VVEKYCLNQTRCSIAVNNSVFGGDPCPFVAKSLSVRATCLGGVTRKRIPTFSVKESGTMIWNGSRVVAQIDGIVSTRPTSTFVEFQVLSGDYVFEASAPVAEALQ
jgi:hypothetical protein